MGTHTRDIQGAPEPARISTSDAERQHLTMGLAVRRFTRLSNAFSKKVEHLHQAVSLHCMYSNCARIHKTRRVTPAMEAGINKRAGTLEAIVKLLAAC
jgi:hypothetical protein